MLVCREYVMPEGQDVKLCDLAKVARPEARIGPLQRHPVMAREMQGQ